MPQSILDRAGKYKTYRMSVPFWIVICGQREQAKVLKDYSEVFWVLAAFWRAGI